MTQSFSWNSPREYGWDAPSPTIQGLWRLQSISRILSPQYGWGRFFFFSEVVPERAPQSRSWNFPAVLRAFLKFLSIYLQQTCWALRAEQKPSTGEQCAYLPKVGEGGRGRGGEGRGEGSQSNGGCLRVARFSRIWCSSSSCSVRPSLARHSALIEAAQLVLGLPTLLKFLPAQIFCVNSQYLNCDMKTPHLANLS